MGQLIRYFLVNDNAEGIRTLEISNKTIYCTIFPRPLFKEFARRQENNKPGVYILVGEESESGVDKIYIGEGDPVGKRLADHIGKKDFWNFAMAFTSKDDYLTKTQIQYIESELIRKALEACRILLDNANSPTLPNISEVDESEVQSFLKSLLLLVKAQGYNFFTPLTVNKEKDIAVSEEQSPVFEFVITKHSEMKGKMQIRDGKYVLLAGSQLKMISIHASAWATKIRNELQASGVIKDMEKYLLLEQDVQFNSASGAGAAVYGGNMNGMTNWKYNGKTLAQYEESEKR